MIPNCLAKNEVLRSKEQAIMEIFYAKETCKLIGRVIFEAKNQTPDCETAYNNWIDLLFI